MLIPSDEIQKWINSSKDLMEFQRQFGFYLERNLTDTQDRPASFGVDSEKALVVYLTPELYDFVEGLEGGKEIDFITVGKLYLKVKKHLQEGKFKRV